MMEPANEALIIVHAANAAAALYGSESVFTHEWVRIHLELGEEPEETEAYKRWSHRKRNRTIAWRHEMLDVHGLYVVGVTGVGYMIIPDELVTDTASAHGLDRAIKALSESLAILRRARKEGLTALQLQQRHDREAFLGNAAQTMAKARPRITRPANAPLRAWEQRLIEGEQSAE